MRYSLQELKAMSAGTVLVAKHGPICCKRPIGQSEYANRRGNWRHVQGGGCFADGDVARFEIVARAEPQPIEAELVLPDAPQEVK